MTRTCHVCGKQGPAEGPLPYEFDLHLTNLTIAANGKMASQMVLTCSPKCRAAGGFVERKAAT